MMSGLDRIIEKINADSLASCREIADQAQKRAQDIVSDADERAGQVYAEIIADAEKKAQSIMTMSEANVSGIARRAELSAKVEAVDAAIEAAYDAMCDMGADEYFAALEKLAVRNAGKGEGELRLSKRDLDRVPSGFADRINAALTNGSVKLSGQSADIDNGFILVYGDIEINCTFRALINEQKDIVREKVCGVIF
jgi:V/A-type H+-transporting ATPase subunit E